MTHTPTPVLGLFARRKEIGYAVMRGGVLYRYGVMRIRAKGNGHEFAKAVLRSLCKLLTCIGSDGLIVLEQLSPSPKAPKPKADIPRIVKHFVEGVYVVTEIPLALVKQHGCDDPNATHHALVEAILPRYPVFSRHLQNAKPYKANYWEKAIIAVGLAEAASLQLQAHRRSVTAREHPIRHKPLKRRPRTA